MIRTGSSTTLTRPRWLRTGALALAACVVAAARVDAQAATRGDPQAVSLRIGPPVGETLRMRLDQRVEMTGTTRVSDGDSTTTMVTTLLVLSRAYVERRDRDATIVLASTDSIVASSTGPELPMISPDALRALQGKRVRLRIAPDGATEVVGGDSGAELNAVFSQMPATLPRTPIPVGQTWSRVMEAPLAGPPAVGSGGTLHVRFRLDSLSANGDWAHVSLQGTLSPPGSSRDALGTLTVSGSMEGGLVIDRKRGWITDARMTYLVRSVLTPPAGSNAAALRFRMKVTQWMRAER